MKKTTKKTPMQYRAVHTPAQKFWGWMALIALFICGIMVGVGINSNSEKNSAINTAQASVQPGPEMDNNPEKTCTLIEESLLVRLPQGDAGASSFDRIERAKIYANLSERGCAENSQKYYDMAKQELAIARALEDDEFDEFETIEVVETYKRLNMQAAAEEIFETAKRLTNPAIDFILEVEKIINEQ